jgi:RHS repeat-associated protein
VVTNLYHANLGRMRRLIAVRKNGTLYWVGTDHLGGAVRVADSSLAAVDQMRYTPYGVPRDAGANLPTDHLYTSQVYDHSVGLYWYGSRAYDPQTGRFTAPDPVVPRPRGSPALNRYSYPRNNPLLPRTTTMAARLSCPRQWRRRCTRGPARPPANRAPSWAC